MKGSPGVSRRGWTTAEVARLRRDYATVPAAEIAAAVGRTPAAVAVMANKLRLGKAEGYINPGNFAAGHKPWNKGGQHPGARDQPGHFKPGNLPHGTRHIGAESIRHGVVYRKVADTRVRRVDWRAVKDLVWEAAHGPIPAGHLVVTENRDAFDFRLENLLLMTRADLMRRNNPATAAARSQRVRKGWKGRRPAFAQAVMTMAAVAAARPAEEPV